jgi:hypothetical protein
MAMHSDSNSSVERQAQHSEEEGLTLALSWALAAHFVVLDWVLLCRLPQENSSNY